VRDLIGPNSIFVSQSSTFPQKAHDVPSCAAAERASLAEAMSRSFLGETKCTSSRLVAVHRLLGSLGSHDLSLMREAFGGVPTRCESAWANGTGDFMGAQIVYARRGAGGQAEGEFRVSYETGIHNVGGEFLSARGSGEQRCEKAARAESSCNERQVFDAFIEVFTRDRVLKIQCTSLSLPPPPTPLFPISSPSSDLTCAILQPDDTPYVKGLPITLSVREADADVPGSYQERLVRPTYADAYTAEFEALAQAIVEGKELKSGPQVSLLQRKAQRNERGRDTDEEHRATTAKDAIQDVDIWEMMLAHLN
jgi:hypothetical protein